MNQVLMIPAEEMGNLMNLYNQSKSNGFQRIGAELTKA